MAGATSQQQHLSRLLQEELTHAGQLLQILDAEYEALRQPDAACITALSKEKLDCLQALEQCTRTRTRFLAEQGLSIEALPPDRWQALQTLAARAQKQNEINGGIVTLAQRHTRLALDILTGKDRNDATYGPGGTARGGASSHSLAKA